MTDEYSRHPTSDLRHPNWCAKQDSNLHCALSERAASYQLGYWRIFRKKAWSSVHGIEPATCALQKRCSTAELTEHGADRRI